MLYQKGQSGNPAGRPKSPKHSSSALRAQIATELPAIITSLITLAKSGDATAGKVLMDKVLPSVRPQSLPATLPGLASGTPQERGEAVIQALASGQLSPDLAVLILTALTKIREINGNSEAQIDNDFTITIHDATEYLQMQRDEQHD